MSDIRNANRFLIMSIDFFERILMNKMIYFLSRFYSLVRRQSLIFMFEENECLKLVLLFSVHIVQCVMFRAKVFLCEIENNLITKQLYAKLDIIKR